MKPAATVMAMCKVLNHQTDDRLDPVADDVATPGFDLLVRDPGFCRGGVNPFLIGYQEGRYGCRDFHSQPNSVRR